MPFGTSPANDRVGWIPGVRRDHSGTDLQRLVDTGRGDVPLIHLRYRCSRCRSRLTDFVCTSKYG
jgi:hypothetical protein